MRPYRLFSVQPVILGGSLILAHALALLICYWYPLSSARIIKISQWSALISLIYLYLSLCISPLYTVFPLLPLKEKSIQARRAIGSVGWVFGFMHGIVSFFGQLSGFAGLAFLSNQYQTALIYGAVALFLFSLLMITSSDRARAYFGFLHWKLLHRFTYIATMLTVIHTLMLGTHFREFSRFIPTLFFFFLLVLLLMEAYRLFCYLHGSQSRSLIRSVSFFLTACALSIVGALSMQTGENVLSVHPSHSAKTNAHSPKHSAQPGSGFYELRVISLDDFLAGKPQHLYLQIVDTNTQNVMNYIEPTHERLLHLIVMDENQEWFAHPDPSYDNTYFMTTLTFPHPGKYYLFATFQEIGQTERTITQTVSILASEEAGLQELQESPFVDIELRTPLTMSSAELSSEIGGLSFGLREKVSGKLSMKIDPYFEAPGHVVLIRKDTFEYTHLHPTELSASMSALVSNDSSILFRVPAEQKPVSPGEYTVFAEFSINGQVHTQLFAIVVE